MHHLKIRFALPCLAILIASLSASAQEVTKPFRSQTFSALSEDTSRYSPQIDARFVRQPERPENPWEFTVRKDPPNNLIAGNVRNVVRGLVGPNWPAIGATGWTPPDCDLAVGPNQIVSTVNSSIAFFNKDGTPTFQQTAETFFAGLGASSFQFDPKCFYDRIHQRFVVLFAERDTSPQVSKLLVGVSDDNNPAGVWHKYRIEARITIGSENYWLDYPGFGYNKDALVACGNMFSFSSGFAGVQFIVMPTAPMLSGNPVTAQYLRDENGGSAQITEVIDPNLDRVYAVSRGGTSSLDLYAIRSLTGTPTLQMTSVAVPANTSPQMNAPSTNGNTLDTIDGRIFNTTWRAGKLVAAHTIQESSSLKVRWYEVNTNNWPVSGSPSLNMSGNVAGAGVAHHMPAVSTNSVGDISTMFTRSSTSITADIMVAGRRAGDPAGTMGLPINMESSAGNDYSSGRWGDYFGVDVDPVDDTTFWGIGMGVAANNNWRTSIFSWTITPPGVTVVPTTITMDRGSIFAGGVTQLANSDDNRLQLRPGVVLSSSDHPIRARISAVSPHLVPSTIKVIVESQGSAAGISQVVEMFVPGTATWEQINAGTMTVNNDGTVEVNITTNAARFVDGSGNIVLRLSYRATQPVLTFPWTARIDRAVWVVTP